MIVMMKWPEAQRGERKLTSVLTARHMMPRRSERSEMLKAPLRAL